MRRGSPDGVVVWVECWWVGAGRRMGRRMSWCVWGRETRRDARERGRGGGWDAGVERARVRPEAVEKAGLPSVVWVKLVKDWHTGAHLDVDGAKGVVRKETGVKLGSDSVDLVFGHFSRKCH